MRIELMCALSQFASIQDCQSQETDLELASKERSNKEINAAGDALRLNALQNSTSEWILVVSNWRSSHESAMKNVMRVLRRHARINNHSAVISGRAKRLQSIAAKLNREQSMALSTMQDIAGCRVVLDTVEIAEVFANGIRGELTEKLSPLREIKEKNYIDGPKADGYRSMHFVVSYESRNAAVLRPRRVEIQVRSLLQHRWATALEAVDLFTGQTLKNGGGDSRWRRFFAVSSGIFAHQEGRPPVPGMPVSLRELQKEMNYLATELRVVKKLQAWTNVIKVASEGPKPHFVYSYLVELDVDEGTTQISEYGPDSLIAAERDYLKAELRNNNLSNSNAVLVKAYSVAEVRKSFPGYYGDTKAFLQALQLTK
jgi:ppGpp synthetase/RelA/SpoT-type nucleotidyltranferase